MTEAKSTNLRINKKNDNTEEILHKFRTIRNLKIKKSMGR